MKYVKIHYLIIFLLLNGLAKAQEFNCSIEISDDQLEGNSFEFVAGALKNDLEAYINDYRWTEIEFQEFEQINCQISIILLSGDQDFNFSAETILQIRRPIYNTSSETITIVLSDGTWQFNYPEGRNLIHDDLEFEALTGFIDYYMYLILGFDFDTFSELGGTEYFSKSQNVVDLAQNSSAIGWNRSTNNGRNRFVLISDLLNNNYETVRSAYYRYHRLVLDRFVTNPNPARSELVNLLKEIRDAKRRSTNNYLFDLFFGTKNKEIVSVLEDAESDLKLEAYNILRETDSANLSVYDVLQN